MQPLTSFFISLLGCAERWRRSDAIVDYAYDTSVVRYGALKTQLASSPTEMLILRSLTEGIQCPVMPVLQVAGDGDRM